MIDKYSFMDVLKVNGFSPIDEDGCVMIITPNKEDKNKMQSLAEKCGYAGRGSYGWRKVRTDKPAAKQIDEYITENN